MNRIAHRLCFAGACAVLVGCVNEEQRNQSRVFAARDSQLADLDRQMATRDADDRIRNVRLGAYRSDSAMVFQAAPVIAISANAPPTLRCAAVPTAAEIQTASFRFEKTVYTRDKAIQFGIPGVTKASASASTMFVVVDYKRSSECETQDPDVKLVYGHWIRTVISLDDFQGQVSTSIPFLAASGTLRNKSQTIQVTSEGISSPRLNDLIAGISNKELNVENYALFSNYIATLPLIPYDTATKIEVRLLGLKEAPRLSHALITSFALHEISRGKTCAETKRSLPSALQDLGVVVEDVYQSIAETCDASTRPNAEFMARARTRLQGFKISRPG